MYFTTSSYIVFVASKTRAEQRENARIHAHTHAHYLSLVCRVHEKFTTFISDESERRKIRESRAGEGGLDVKSNEILGIVNQSRNTRVWLALGGAKKKSGTLEKVKVGQ